MIKLVSQYPTPGKDCCSPLMSETISYVLRVTIAPVHGHGGQQRPLQQVAVLTRQSQQHRTCTFGLQVSELRCQPAHTSHGALWLFSIPRGIRSPEAQTHQIPTGPALGGSWQTACASSILPPTPSTCWYQPQKPHHALDPRCPSHHKVPIATHVAGRVSHTTPQVR